MSTTVKRDCIECGTTFDVRDVMPEPANGIANVGKPFSICSAACRKKRRNRQQMAWRRRVECPGHMHGTLSGYGTYGCRCEPCREANTMYTRDKRAKAKAEATSR